MVQLLFQQSPNGMWWLAGNGEPVAPDYIINLCANGIIALSVPESQDTDEHKLLPYRQ